MHELVQINFLIDKNKGILYLSQYRRHGRQAQLIILFLAVTRTPDA